MFLYFLNLTSCCWSFFWEKVILSIQKTSNMEVRDFLNKNSMMLSFRKQQTWSYLSGHMCVQTWHFEFSALCKHYVIREKIWNMIFLWCLPFTNLRCFIEKNSTNIGKILSFSSGNTLSGICECLCYNCTNISIFVP